MSIYSESIEPVELATKSLPREAGMIALYGAITAVSAVALFRGEGVRQKILPTVAMLAGASATFCEVFPKTVEDDGLL